MRYITTEASNEIWNKESVKTFKPNQFRILCEKSRNFKANSIIDV